MLSPNISKTVEGYLICENVPLCRSGYQDYLGKELEDFTGYEKSWDLNPNQIYRVYRPKEEVLSPDFIASLEGKTVVDEHPDGHVVHVDNDQELNCGHVEKVGPGPVIDGEVTLKGDLIIKNPDLIEKVRPESDPDNEYGTAVRDVSCGYGVHLKRLDDGAIVMHRLRGNHVAVVEKGRAGPRFAIKDSAPPEIKIIKEPIMSLRKTIIGRGIQALFGDISQAEKDSLMAELDASGTTRIATDAEPKEMHPAHACLDRCLSAMKAGDSAALEEHKKELFKHIGHHEPEHVDDSEVEKLKEEEKEEKPKKKMEDEELEQEEKTPAEEKEKTHATDSEGAEKEIDDPGESVLKAANDSVRTYIRNTRPLVAIIAGKDKSKRSKTEQIMLDSYNGAVKGLNSQVGRRSTYSALAKTKTPEGIPALVTDSSAVTKAPETCNCFDGVPYKVGLKRHETAHQKGVK